MKLKFHYKTAATGTAVNWCDATAAAHGTTAGYKK
jgi:hypothetical protein